MAQTASNNIARGAELPPAGTYALDAAHSSVGFVARHLMVSKVRGRFTDVDATIEVGSDLASSRVDATIRVASITTGNDLRDNHLRSGDFLDVERHPVATFRSTGVTRTGDDTLAVAGDLTIRGVTRPVVLDVVYLGILPGGGEAARLAFEASTEIDREAFGMTWNQAIESGGVVVGKKVRVELDLQAVVAGA